MRGLEVPPNLRTCASAVGALAKGRDAEIALRLLGDLRRHGLQPDARLSGLLSALGPPQRLEGAAGAAAVCHCQ
eukprot:4686104-Lingulodinium_polyedra.AAC.1